ncbi:MAG: tetraacyldisaccharide 4'-kinase [Pirellulaceae bacterium]
MLDREQVDRLLSGSARDARSRLIRAGLRGLEPVYRGITGIRNRTWDRRGYRAARVTVPVISIGNLTTGGTGKTPLVRWVVQKLLDSGRCPAIVSRGYGSRPGEPNDEFRELQLFLPDTPHIQNPDRVAAARQAIAQHRADCLVLDDGFQHRRLARDLDIVLIDATCPFGFDHLLPRGLLREPVASLRRADAVIITRVDQVNVAELKRIRSVIEPFVTADQIAEVSFRPSGWLDVQGDSHKALPFAGPLLAFCGIGNPAGFRRTVQNCCPDVVEFHQFPDHHHYSSSDLALLNHRATAHNALAMICTIKDLVKVRELAAGALPCLALGIAAQFEHGESLIRDLILNTRIQIERAA